MHHIGYMSRAIKDQLPKDLEILWQRSADYNDVNGITGLLIYDHVRYMQVIEGDEVAVRRLMATIAADSRHDRIFIMVDGPVTERAFESWGLACVGLRNIMSPSELLADVKAAVANVKDANVMAAFIGFAALAR